jgi:outer membrane protein assembly factor BamD (BamD/ComL family)
MESLNQPVIAVCFPESRYNCRPSVAHGIHCQFVQSEVNVAEILLHPCRGYIAAVNRAQTAIADYRDVPAPEEATFIPVCRNGLTRHGLRDDTRRIMEKHTPAAVTSTGSSSESLYTSFGERIPNNLKFGPHCSPLHGGQS